MRSVTINGSLIALVLAVSIPCAAQAAEGGRISGSILFELQNDLTYWSEDPGAERDDLTPKIEAAVVVRPAAGLSIETELELGSIGNLDPGENRFIGDPGIALNVLTVAHERGPLKVFAGKFGVNSSIGYDVAPGVYGTNLLEDDIELSKRVGFGAAHGFGGADIGEHEVSASAFFIDTSDFSRTFGNDAGRTRLSDGGPSNTARPTSFAITLDGGTIPGAPEFRYHLGFVRQSVERVLDAAAAPLADVDDEYRVVVAAEMPFAAGNGVSVTPLAEYVRVWNYGGVPDEHRNYLTTAARLDYRAWNLAISYTGRFTEGASGGTTGDGQFQVSLGYAFDCGLDASLGWKISDDAGIQSRVVGALLAYTLVF